MDIFSINNYRQIIQGQIKANRQQRGYQSRLAEAAGCHVSFLSQILHSHVQLTPDQAAGLCAFWGLSEDASEYFVTLVNRERCHSRPYAKMLDRKIEELQAKHRDFSQRLQKPKALELDGQVRYYSSWYWAAVHILAHIPRFKRPEDFAAVLQLPPTTIQECLEGLEGMGLIARKADHWTVLVSHVHLPRSSPLNGVNHMQWRNVAIAKLQRAPQSDLHFSSVFSLAQDDIPRIRDRLLRAVDEVLAIVKPSRDEEAAGFFCDFFPITAGGIL